MEVYSGDKPFKEQFCELDLVDMFLAENHQKEISKENATSAVLYLAKKQIFNPLKTFLEDLGFRIGFKMSDEEIDGILDNLANIYLGTNNKLYDEYVKRWLLAAVGRVLCPGCYMRNVLILQGAQGIGKTSFFKILGGEYFSSSLGDAKNKDELMVAHANWILEWGELETIWGKKLIGDVKRFITQTHDTFRPPYGRNTITKPRSFVLCGTTNEREILTDKTGNSRFWVVEVREPLRLDLIEFAREEILAAAAIRVIQYRDNHPDLFMQGKLWELPPEYHQLDNENTEEFTEQHEWEESIKNVIEQFGGCGWIDPVKVWDELDITTKERPRYKMQVGSLMNRLGWKSGVKKIDGKAKRVWMPNS